MLLHHHDKPLPKIVRNQILQTYIPEESLSCYEEEAEKQEKHFTVWKIVNVATEK